MTARSLQLLFVFSVGVVLLLVSCSKKKVIPIGEFESYQDQAYAFGISYPKDWIRNAEVGRRVRIYSSFDAQDRFLDPTGSKRAGMYIEVGIDTTKGQTLDAYAKDVEQDMAGIWTVKPVEQTTLGDQPAIKIPFTIPIDSRNQVVGYRVAAMKNDVITYVEVSGFSGVFDDYKLIIDTSLTTVRFGRLMTAKSKEDISKPSETFETYKGEFFDLEYPSNFEYRLPKKPNTDIVMDLKGYREDCTMKIEVSDAKNLTVDKVVAQNGSILQKAGYKTKKKVSVTIDGNKGTLIDLTYTKGDVDSRAYYTVKNNKLYFIFLTWYRPQAIVYIPTFEKMVASLKLK
jgi:hypothetical protein